MVGPIFEQTQTAHARMCESVNPVVYRRSLYNHGPAVRKLCFAKWTLFIAAVGIWLCLNYTHATTSGSRTIHFVLHLDFAVLQLAVGSEKWKGERYQTCGHMLNQHGMRYACMTST